jgi:DNA adenine methylase
LVDWFCRLRDRLRTVRACCGHWWRVCDSESVTTRLGPTGIFYDPPYSAETGRAADLYGVDSPTVAADVRRCCIEHGADPMFRIVLAGLEGEHDELLSYGWTVEAWKNPGGYNNRTSKGKERAGRERLYCSPHCLRPSAATDDGEGGGS